MLRRTSRYVLRLGFDIEPYFVHGVHMHADIAHIYTEVVEKVKAQARERDGGGGGAGEIEESWNKDAAGTRLHHRGIERAGKVW